MSRPVCAGAGFVDVGGLVLHAERHGGPDAPVVVFVNSLGTDARIWRTVLPKLPAAYGTLVFDKRGHGLSDTPPGRWSIEDHARDLLGLLDRYDLDRFALVGVSVGGMIAQAVAAAHPERVTALVLCDTAARIGDAAIWDARIAAVESQGLGAIAETIVDGWFTAGYRAREPAAMRGWLNMLARQPAQGYVATCAAIRDADLRPDARMIRAPTLCLAGDQDLSTPPDLVRATAALIGGAGFELIAAAGHIPCVEQPDAVAGHIARHLADAGFR